MIIFNKINKEALLRVFPLFIITILFFIIPDLARYLQFDRVKVINGELWRIFTCHFMHVSFEHIFYDLLIFIVIGYLCIIRDFKKFIICISLSLLAIPIIILIFMPEIMYYQGLSGIDSAIFILFTSLILKENLKEKNWGKFLIISIFYILFIFKIFFEINNVSGLFVDTKGANMIPIPLAHLVGAVIGFISAFFDKNNIDTFIKTIKNYCQKKNNLI